MAELGQCRMTGVDIKEYPEWKERQSPQTKLLALDITHGSPFPAASFDFIFSFAVLEHVSDPQAMLRTLAALLKTGGGIFLYVNLYRGPKASHRYREIFFPWPHLLFTDEVFMEYYRSLGKDKVRPAWVNKMTHLHYTSLLDELGLRIARLSYAKLEPDSVFRDCFIEKLGRYPQEDLALDFIHVYAVKPGGNFFKSARSRFCMTLRGLFRSRRNGDK
jgi:SAM-dependent methyltransferase